jgi:hypothetical protein
MADASLPVERLFDIELPVTIPSTIADAPSGTRVLVEVTGGSFEGPRLKGTVVGRVGTGPSSAPTATSGSTCGSCSGPTTASTST